MSLGSITLTFPGHSHQVMVDTASLDVRMSERPGVHPMVAAMTMEQVVIGWVRPDGGTWYAYPLHRPFIGAFRTMPEAAEALLDDHLRKERGRE